MPNFTFENVTPDTLRAYHDLNAAADTFDALRERLASGRLSFEHLFVLRSGDVIEAAVLIGRGPVIVPRMRFDAPDDALHALAAEVHARARENQVLLLDATIAPARPEVFEAARWRPRSHDVTYETDLRRHAHSRDEHVRERPLVDLRASDVTALLHAVEAHDGGVSGDVGERAADVCERELEQSDRRLFTFEEGGAALGAATFGVGPRGEASVHLLGVAPSARGRGVGRRLHAHVLAVAGEVAERHVGATSAGNTAMRRVFERNGGVRRAEQWQFTRDAP